ncbi:MAG: hypothetical protein K6G56_08340 [Clostridiales bacterium]|nr:hypothetical protein [Clostridiales bacterium]
MKKGLIFLLIIPLMMLIAGCSQKTYRLNEILDIKDERPQSIVIVFDDPSSEQIKIENPDEIDLIISKLADQSYKKITGAPAPLGNTALELQYSDGSKIKIGAVYVMDRKGNLFQAESLEFASFLESLNS